MIKLPGTKNNGGVIGCAVLRILLEGALSTVPLCVESLGKTPTLKTEPVKKPANSSSRNMEIGKFQVGENSVYQMG